MIHPTRLCLVSIVASAALGLHAFAQDRVPGTRPTTQAGAVEVEDVKLSVGRADEYDDVIADLGLTGEQLQRFRAQDQNRLTRLREFVESAKGKQLVELREELAAARRARRPAEEIAEVRTRIKPLSDEYWSVRNAGRVSLLETLDDSQLKRYVGFTLYGRVMRGTEQLALSAEQQARARALCDEAAAAWATPEILAADPYFRGLLEIEAPTRKRVVEEVLTADQKLALRQPRVPASRPTR